MKLVYSVEKVVYPAGHNGFEPWIREYHVCCQLMLDLIRDTELEIGVTIDQNTGEFDDIYIGDGVHYCAWIYGTRHCPYCGNNINIDVIDPINSERWKDYEKFRIRRLNEYKIFMGGQEMEMPKTGSPL